MKQFRANNYTARIEGYIYEDSRNYGTALLFIEVNHNRQSKYYVFTDDDWLGAGIEEQTPDCWEKQEKELTEISKYFHYDSPFEVPVTALSQVLEITKGKLCRIEDYDGDAENSDWDIINKYNKLPNL